MKNLKEDWTQTENYRLDRINQKSSFTELILAGQTHK